ncbi:hypothetical protein ACFTXM_05390 [Streptomyces sp. NPDC056930]|uniref:hypothetical protein n=1 Tax=Streptomyces sp. NPDC056930 TaxID=3345967 RepID=UPI0036368CB7
MSRLLPTTADLGTKAGKNPSSSVSPTGPADRDPAAIGLGTDNGSGEGGGEEGEDVAGKRDPADTEDAGNEGSTRPKDPVMLGEEFGMWETDEFGSEHEGRPGVLLADGTEPGQVYFDAGSGPRVRDAFHRQPGEGRAG